MPMISIDGMPVNLLDEGVGMPVVLLHAGGSSAKQWVGVSKSLATSCRVIAPDLWSCGNSAPWPGPDQLTHDHQAKLVAEAIDHLRTGPAHIVGHSYGGATAIRLALLHPDVVNTLTVIEPILTPLLKIAGDVELFEEYVALANRFSDLVNKGRPHAAWREFIDYRSGNGAWDAMTERARKRFVDDTEGGLAAFYANLENRTTLVDLRGILIPTLVLCGESTTPLDRRIAEIVHDSFPSSAFQIIPGAGHMSPITHPELVAAAIRQFVSSRQ